MTTIEISESFEIFYCRMCIVQNALDLHMQHVILGQSWLSTNKLKQKDQITIFSFKQCYTYLRLHLFNTFGMYSCSHFLAQFTMWKYLKAWLNNFPLRVWPHPPNPVIEECALCKMDLIYAAKNFVMIMITNHQT